VNTIKRARKRPRTASVNFRTLWWLVHLEGAAQILYAGTLASAYGPRTRIYLLKASRRALERAVSTALELQPQRRWHP